MLTLRGPWIQEHGHGIFRGGDQKEQVRKGNRARKVREHRKMTYTNK